MNLDVRVNTTSDLSAIDQALAKIREFKATLDKLGSTPVTKAINDDLQRTDALAAKAGATFTRNESAAMRDLNRRFAFQRSMTRQRDSEEAETARQSRMFDSEALTRLRERMSFSSRMSKQQEQEARDLARVQAEASRSAARAARDAARDQAQAIKAQIGQFRELERERARAMKAAGASVGRMSGAVRRGAVAGAAGAAIVGAGARKSFDKLTQSGVSIDDALTQAAIHIYGTQTPKEARKSAEALRRKLMPVATKLGSKTADLIGAYVEASQAGVDSDILDKVVGDGARYAKMNKLNLPNTLEESGYALQGLKAFGQVNEAIVGKLFNHQAYLIATTAANREQMTSFTKRGLAAGASVGMNLDDTLAFGAAATAAGAQGSQASRMLSSQGGRIAGWEMKSRDIMRKRNRTEEDRQFLQAPAMLGFGGFPQMAASFKKDFLGTFATVQDGLKRISDPLKRRSLEKQLFGQEFGSLTDAMVMGSNLRDYRNKLRSSEADTFLDRNWEKETGNLGFIIDQVKAVFGNLSDSLGLVLKPIWSDLRDWAVRTPAAFQGLEDTFRVSIRGFLGGLGSSDGTMAGLLRHWFGDPAGFKLNSAAWSDFFRGVGQGLRDVGETIRSFFRVFTGSDGSPEAIGRWTARILGFSAALVAASPVIAVLGGISSAVLAFVAVCRAAYAGMKAMGLVGGAAGAAGAARGAGAAAGAAAGAGAAGKGILGRLGGLLGIYTLADEAQNWGALKPPTTEKSLGRNILDFLDPGIGAWWYGDAAKAGSATGSWVDPLSRDQAATGQPVAANQAKAPSLAERVRGELVTSLDLLRASVDALRDAMGKGGGSGIISRASEEVSETVAKVGQALRTSAIDAERARFIARVTEAAERHFGPLSQPSSVTGVPYTAGAGGAALFNSTPGGKLPDLGGSGVRGSGGFGGSNRRRGGESDAVDASDNSPIAPHRGSRNFAGLAPRIAADLQKDFGLSKEESSAILGNLGHESGGFTAFQEKNPRGGRGGFGWAQWTGPRRRQFEAWARARALDPKSYEANYGFLRHELQTTYKGSITALKRAYGLDGKTVAFEKSFEGAGVKAYGLRLKFARQAMTLPDTQPGVAGPAQAASLDTTAGVAGTGNVLGRLQELRANGSVLNEQCVSLAKAAVGVSDSVTTWRKGVAAETGTLKPGTPIATFLDRFGRQSDRYAGGGTGTMGAHRDHAGVFESYIRDKAGKIIGMNIAEQFKGSHGVHSKAYRFGDGYGEGDARNYHAVMDRAGRYLGGDLNPMNREERGLADRAPTDPATLAKQSPAERLAQSAPFDHVRAGAGAGRGGAVHAPITIHNNGDAEHTANQVQRRLQDTTNYLTQDLPAYV